jgi:hypothetical protein
MPIDQPPQICRAMEVTPGCDLTIEGEVDGAKQFRRFVVPAGVRHLTVCLKHGARGSRALSLGDPIGTTNRAKACEFRVRGTSVPLLPPRHVRLNW